MASVKLEFGGLDVSGSGDMASLIAMETARLSNTS